MQTRLRIFLMLLLYTTTMMPWLWISHDQHQWLWLWLNVTSSRSRVHETCSSPSPSEFGTLTLQDKGVKPLTEQTETGFPGNSKTITPFGTSQTKVSERALRANQSPLPMTTNMASICLHLFYVDLDEFKRF